MATQFNEINYSVWIQESHCGTFLTKGALRVLLRSYKQTKEITCVYVFHEEGEMGRL